MMPIGIQFSNSDKYRRYPFADDSDVSCSTASGAVFELPTAFMPAFRFVHVGDSRVADVRFAGCSKTDGENGKSVFSFSFRVLDEDGKPIEFHRQGQPLVEEGELPEPVVEEGELPEPIVVECESESDDVDVVFRIRDFDFSQCMSICVHADFSTLPNGVSSFGCDIPMAPGTVLSMHGPFVSSVLDDNGSPIRDAETVEIVAGKNVKLDVVKDRNEIIVSAFPGAGEGKACGESGLSSIFASANLKTVNGVGATLFGDVSVSGGRGVHVEAIEGTNVINVYGDLTDESSLECAAK